MAIYKNVSSKEIIRKVFRDIKPSTANFVHDAVEWIGEALEHIGSSPQLCQKQMVIDITDHKGCLPGDLYYINQVAVNTCVSSAIDSQINTVTNQIEDLNSNILNYSSQLTAVTTPTTVDLNAYRVASNNQLRDLNVNLKVLTNMYFTGGSCLSPLQYGASTFHNSIHCDGCVNATVRYKDTYIIDCGYVKTSFATGKICISYMAFPTDEECYPLVPDDISFREAMFWYIYKKLLLQGITGRNTKLGYEYAENMWQNYCTQARNSANYPDIDKYESFMNQWVRLVPDINAHSTFFESLNDREQFTSDNF
jgi:hypothetical protein|tara:strand:+ start:473 stop:1399 length:927 start_codon:yes stop_codon:yes gene_type:complete